MNTYRCMKELYNILIKLCVFSKLQYLYSLYIYFHDCLNFINQVLITFLLLYLHLYQEDSISKYLIGYLKTLYNALIYRSSIVKTIVLYKNSKIIHENNLNSKLFSTFDRNFSNYQ